MALNLTKPIHIHTLFKRKKDFAKLSNRSWASSPQLETCTRSWSQAHVPFFHPPPPHNHGPNGREYVLFAESISARQTTAHGMQQCSARTMTVCGSGAVHLLSSCRYRGRSVENGPNATGTFPTKRPEHH